MIKAYIKFWQNALKSEGISSRSDYWWTFLVNEIFRAIILFIELIIILNFFWGKISPGFTETQLLEVANQAIDHPDTAMLTISIIYTIFNLVVMLPITTLTARRLRDAGLPAGLAYPLPAIYIANAFAQFMNVPGLNAISGFLIFYQLLLLFLCFRPSIKNDPFQGDHQ
ncbi:DUF805 domain-containing protein [Lactovum miscens]|nr:DUF805 domain-containing protein [Lactovum miscens]